MKNIKKIFLVGIFGFLAFANSLNARMRAGILPYTIKDGKVLILLGRDKHQKAWTDFGGSSDSRETPQQTAAREGSEETLETFGNQNALIPLIQQSQTIGLTTLVGARGLNPYYMYLVQVNYVPTQNIKNRLDDDHYQDKKYQEKSDFAWVRASDLYNAINRNYNNVYTYDEGKGSKQINLYNWFVNSLKSNNVLYKLNEQFPFLQPQHPQPQYQYQPYQPQPQYQYQPYQPQPQFTIPAQQYYRRQPQFTQPPQPQFTPQQPQFIIHPQYQYQHPSAPPQQFTPPAQVQQFTIPSQPTQQYPPQQQILHIMNLNDGSQIYWVPTHDPQSRIIYSDKVLANFNPNRNPQWIFINPAAPNIQLPQGLYFWLSKLTGQGDTIDNASDSIKKMIEISPDERNNLWQTIDVNQTPSGPNFNYNLNSNSYQLQQPQFIPQPTQQPSSTWSASFPSEAPQYQPVPVQFQQPLQQQPQSNNQIAPNTLTSKIIKKPESIYLFTLPPFIPACKVSNDRISVGWEFNQEFNGYELICKSQLTGKFLCPVNPRDHTNPDLFDHLLLLGDFYKENETKENETIEETNQRIIDLFNSLPEDSPLIQKLNNLS